MEIGIGMFGDLTPHGGKNEFQSPKERLSEMLEQVKLAEKVGVDNFVLGEHHRPDYAVSSTEIVLAALASVTKEIKLASGVTVLSSADPVKVYQDYVTLDLLSHNRAEIIAGRGSFTESFPLFGYELKDYNELFEEKLDLLLKLNKEDTITWKGKFRPSLNAQTIYPRPERELPVWIAVGGTPESIDRAARLGLPIMLAIIGGMPRQFKSLVEYYKEQYQKYGHDMSKMQIGVHSHTFVCESIEDLLENYYPGYAAQMDRIGATRGWLPYSKQQFLHGLSRDGALYMGDPSEVTEKILETIEMFGLTRYVAHIDVGGPTHKQLMKTIELFGEKVLPQIRKATES